MRKIFVLFFKNIPISVTFLPLRRLLYVFNLKIVMH